ncbi:hypothetical protein M404DRAFT_7248 [Pisolithus tinctorius Marx 270]|uniref:Uncharacterized protein n=1 Tax=Pisolithus tinctorius Marx 270 TaxID=870435 RepID=A0A0C3PQ91_PISTI|nr:hypothetical protein M404DRAFT_7248 [Pisolithus tinctorius Marx 270]
MTKHQISESPAVILTADRTMSTSERDVSPLMSDGDMELEDIRAALPSPKKPLSAAAKKRAPKCRKVVNQEESIFADTINSLDPEDQDLHSPRKNPPCAPCCQKKSNGF